MNWKAIGIGVLLTALAAAAALGTACYLEAQGQGCRVASFWAPDGGQGGGGPE
jgi:hypothetical protein